MPMQAYHAMKFNCASMKMEPPTTENYSLSLWFVHFVKKQNKGK